MSQENEESQKDIRRLSRIKALIQRKKEDKISLFAELYKCIRENVVIGIQVVPEIHGRVESFLFSHFFCLELKNCP